MFFLFFFYHNVSYNVGVGVGVFVGVFVGVIVGVGVGPGQVPQTGLGNDQEVAPALKFEGVEGIKETHQLDKSWLKEVASLNI
jgi:hypothetical protein